MPRERSEKLIEEHTQSIQEFYESHKRMPSYAEACVLFDVKSKDTAFRIIQKLVATGVVDRDATGEIIPKHSGGNISKKVSCLRVLGLVEAGFPTPAEEDLLETITLDDWIIKNRNASFMLQVKGDSMIDAGIRDGDMVIVERGVDYKPGDIVIARTEEGSTIKYLRKKSAEFYLEPANSEYANIYPEEILEIMAVVRAVVRKY